MAGQMEEAGRLMGKRLGWLVSRLEREARQAARKGKAMQSTARKRSIEWLRRAAWALNKLALEMEKGGRQGSRRAAGRRRAKRRR